ncbi:DUF3618 domain-containing protein [Sanguibacter antarcticus]|uniref:Uncharacterized protein DUF3618 n=1 Tax=Sanguibacter antarcticus TaxID=372484 RepID=A0A2A9E827_9MICO|nr:DUF3618 domain-containing protein [Sanguibacter antarcticus]PFG35108.1 uncharacterized protein DUF3618 [Sanguibacter antarcticus]
MSTTDRSELEAEITVARAQLAATVDELAARLSPKALAAEARSTTKQAANDAGAFLTGNGLPVGPASRARNAKVLLGAVAGVVVIVALVIVKRR